MPHADSGSRPDSTAGHMTYGGIWRKSGTPDSFSLVSRLTYTREDELECGSQGHEYTDVLFAAPVGWHASPSCDRVTSLPH